MEQTKKKNKIIFLVGAGILCVMFLVAIVQTFVLNSGKASLNNLKGSNTELEQTLKEKEEEYDYKNDPDYNNDYSKHEGDYGNEGDKIIKP